jgi:hypothetical protein
LALTKRRSEVLNTILLLRKSLSRSTAALVTSPQLAPRCIGFVGFDPRIPIFKYVLHEGKFLGPGVLDMIIDIVAELEFGEFKGNIMDRKCADCFIQECGEEYLWIVINVDYTETFKS